MPEYIDPTTDFGFKKLFGNAANKDLTMSFISDVLGLSSPLTDVTFLDKEQLPEILEQRTGAFDIFCQDASERRFIVEMQRNRVPYIKDRLLYYATFPIMAHGQKGKHFFRVRHDRIREDTLLTYEISPLKKGWNYRLESIYCIAVLDYALNGSTKVINRNSLRTDEPPFQRFYDRLQFVTVELPLFDPQKPEYTLDRHMNKWLFFLNYLQDLDSIPVFFQDAPIFVKAFQVAAVANLTNREYLTYWYSLKRLRDACAIFNYNFARGLKRGKAKGRAEGFARGEKAGKIKGKIEGKIEGKQDAILSFLAQKFGDIPEEIRIKIQSLNDENKINEILNQILTSNDLDDFKKLLD